MFLSSGDGYVGELLELHQGSKGHFRGSRGNIDFSLELHQGSQGHFHGSRGNIDFSLDVAAEKSLISR